MSIKLPDWYRFIKHNICHRTGIKGLKGIFKTGAIIPNDGSLTDTYPQSQVSYARYHHFVSLFDFDFSTEEDCRNQLHEWYRFFFDHKPVTIVILLNRRALSPKIISNEKACEDTNGSYNPIFIPHLEVFYPESIPCEFFLGYLIICGVYETVFEYYPHKGIFPEIFEKIERFIEKHAELYADPLKQLEKDIDKQ